MEIRRSYDRFISTMGFPILVRWHLYIESGPCCEDFGENLSHDNRTTLNYIYIICQTSLMFHWSHKLTILSNFMLSSQSCSVIEHHPRTGRHYITQVRVIWPECWTHMIEYQLTGKPIRTTSIFIKRFTIGTHSSPICPTVHFTNTD